MSPVTSRTCAAVGREPAHLMRPILSSAVAVIALAWPRARSVRQPAELCSRFAELGRGAAQAIGEDPHDFDRHLGKFREQTDELILLDTERLERSNGFDCGRPGNVA